MCLLGLKIKLLKTYLITLKSLGLSLCEDQHCSLRSYKYEVFVDLFYSPRKIKTQILEPDFMTIQYVFLKNEQKSKFHTLYYMQLQ